MNYFLMIAEAVKEYDTGYREGLDSNFLVILIVLILFVSACVALLEEMNRK